MNPDELLFYKIDDYLRGQLPAEERAAFESELAADAGLAALVQRQKQENGALELLTERDLFVRMNAWERQMPPAMTPVRGGRLIWLRWAVAAVVVLGAGWWLLRPKTGLETPAVTQTETPVAKPKTSPKNPSSPKTKPKLPATRPEPPKEVITQAPKTKPVPTPVPVQKTLDYAAIADDYYRERDFFSGPGTSGKGNTSYDRALDDFQNGRYSDLIPQLRPGGKLAGTDLKTKELLAHSLLKSRQYDAAIRAFQEIINSRKQPYADRADWALALTCLHQMPQRSGLLDVVLRKMAGDPGHLFHGQAQGLRARLKRG